MFPTSIYMSIQEGEGKTKPKKAAAKVAKKRKHPQIRMYRDSKGRYIKTGTKKIYIDDKISGNALTMWLVKHFTKKRKRAKGAKGKCAKEVAPGKQSSVFSTEHKSSAAAAAAGGDPSTALVAVNRRVYDGYQDEKFAIEEAMRRLAAMQNAQNAPQTPERKRIGAPDSYVEEPPDSEPKAPDSVRKELERAKVERESLADQAAESAAETKKAHKKQDHDDTIKWLMKHDTKTYKIESLNLRLKALPQPVRPTEAEMKDPK
jgi:hypothetical protein